MSESGALSGTRILVTRAKEQAEKTAEKIRARGAEAILLPAIELHAPKDEGAISAAVVKLRARAYGWIAFTSTNGVAWTWRALDARKLEARLLDGLKIAAIGPGTAEALAARGLRVDVTATAHHGEGLAEAMLDAMRLDPGTGQSVLLPRAQVARDVLPDALREAGHAVDVVAVYETRAASGQAVATVSRDLERGAIDAVTFTSASTVDNFVALAGGDARARALVARTLVASIGPITSAALAAHGLRVDAEAREATITALLDAIEAAIGRIRHL